MRALFAITTAVVLAGCTVGPNYKTPEMHMPVAFRNLPTAAADAPLSRAEATAADLSRWWLQFNDAELNRLISRALAANLDLQSAASRIREARQQEIIAGAAGLPSVSASGLAAKVHSGSNPLAAASGAQGGSSGGTTLNLYSIGFDATWEVDIFGGVRRAVEAAKADADVAEWQMRDGEVSLTAEIASNYLALRATQNRIAVLTAQYHSEEDTLRLVVAREKTGFVTQLDANQQTTAVANARAAIRPLDAQMRVLEHAIAVLMGIEPEALIAELDAPAQLPTLPPTLPVGLPADLLRRRPDVRAAERKLAAATAQKGVAIAALYPKLNLLALVGLGSNQLSNLMSSSSLTEAGAGQLAWPLFNGGRIHANIHVKEEEAQQAYFAYRAAVLKAIQDCEDALIRYDRDQQRLMDLETAMKSGRSSVELSLRQYRTGLATYLTVLSAQSQYETTQDALTQSQQTVAQDLASLYKALGGGWTVDNPTETARPAPAS